MRCLPLVALLACGDGLVEPGFVGEPIYTHPFFVISVSTTLPENPRWAVFWLPDGLAASDFDEPVEQQGTSRRLEASVGTLHLFRAPSAALLARTETGARYGIGRLFVYDDANGNLIRDPDEPFIGRDKYGMYYAPTDLAAEDSPTGRALRGGIIESSSRCRAAEPWTAIAWTATCPSPGAVGTNASAAPARA